MFRKDLITAEIDKLAQVLARIMGLKVEGSLAEANQLLAETLETSFKLPNGILAQNDIVAFKNWLNETDLTAEKLDSLSEFLYYELGSSAERNQLIAPKLDLIYQLLIEKHKVVHLVNFHRKQIIQQYL